MELGSSSIEHMMYCKAKPYYLLQRKQGRMQYNKILCRKLDTLNLLFEHLKWSANKQREQSDGPPIRTGTLKMSKGHPRAMPKGSSDHSRFFGGLSSCSTPRALGPPSGALHLCKWMAILWPAGTDCSAHQLQGVWTLGAALLEWSVSSRIAASCGQLIPPRVTTFCYNL